MNEAGVYSMYDSDADYLFIRSIFILSKQKQGKLLYQVIRTLSLIFNINYCTLLKELGKETLIKYLQITKYLETVNESFLYKLILLTERAGFLIV